MEKRKRKEKKEKKEKWEKAGLHFKKKPSLGL
jgi:hypothetical protein